MAAWAKYCEAPASADAAVVPMRWGTRRYPRPRRSKHLGRLERLREWTFDQLHRADLADLKMREAEDYPLDPRRSLTWLRLML